MERFGVGSAWLSIFTILWLPFIARAQSAAMGTKHVMLFVGTPDELEIFDPLGGEDLHIVTHEQLPRVSASAHPFDGFDVVVWGRNSFHDAPRSALSDSFLQAMRQFVERGGDLVYFEQFAMQNMDLAQKMFAIKVAGACDGALIDNPDLKAHATAAGYDQKRLAKVKFYNSYQDLPKDASIWLRGDDEKHSPTGVLVPFGKGRVILLATNMDPEDKQLDEEFFNQIYHFRSIAAANVPPTDPPELDGNPMDWKENVQPPALRQVLDPVTYEARFKAARQRIDVESLRDPSRPMRGEEVSLVVPGSPADQLGIRPGDIITAIDGIAMGKRSGEFERIDTPPGNKRQVAFWSPTGGEKTVETDARRFGFWSRSGIRPAETYARSNERDPRWDDQVLVAAANFWNDPDLAETALIHAQQAGYNGRLLYPLAVKIAFQQFRYDQALAFGWHLLNSGTLGKDLAANLYQAAVMGFKLEQAVELERRYPDVIVPQPQIAEMARAYRAMPGDNSPNPIAQLPHVKRSKVTSFSAFVPTGAQDFRGDLSQWAANEFNHAHRADVSIPTGHYNVFMLNPSFPNIAVTVNFDLYDSSDEDSQVSSTCDFGLFDTTDPQPHHHLPPNSLKVSVLSSEAIQIRAFGLRNQLLWPAPPHLPFRSKGMLQMVILHNRCEASLNGRRIYYGPVLFPESSRKYGLWIQVIGMSGRITHPIVEELLDPATTQP